MSQTSSSNKNLLQFTIKLTPSQLKYLEDLAEALGLSTQRSALREVLEQFQSWFRLPVSMRERLKKDVAERRVNILRYLQELMARHSEELAKEPSSAKRSHASKTRPRTAAADAMDQLGVRLSPSVLAYCDELKPELGVNSTADVMREIVSQLQNWFDLPCYVAERLQQEMAARRLNIIEYVQGRSPSATTRCGTKSGRAAGRPTHRS
ncbi:MAG TPA: hypothetical protein VFA20_14695 [Myxococcaceae bacterium]|nr:hypothetical protein [Myxococcaceae bacterium]